MTATCDNKPLMIGNTISYDCHDFKTSLYLIRVLYADRQF